MSWRIPPAVRSSVRGLLRDAVVGGNGAQRFARRTAPDQLVVRGEPAKPRFVELVLKVRFAGSSSAVGKDLGKSRTGEGRFQRS